MNLRCPLLFAFALVVSAATADETASRWWETYTGAEANGPQVLGFWRFDTEADLGKDESKHGGTGKLRGSTWRAEGKFGGCLEGGAGFPIADVGHGLSVKRSPALSPGGPFSLEMWIRPKAADAFPPTYAPYLVDSKYVPDNHTGFLWAMTNESASGTRQFKLSMGLGARSETWFSEPFRLEPEVWQHIAFTYDGAGTVTFFRNGAETGRINKPGASSMAAPVRDLVLGDRLGSNYGGFPGWIDEVRLSAGVREFRPVEIESESARPTFLRMSERAKIHASVKNLAAGDLTGIGVKITGVGGVSDAGIEIATLGKGEARALEIPIDSRLRPGEYEIEITVDTPDWGGGEAAHRSTSRIPFVIVPRPLPHRMPVVMWGLGGTEGVIKEIPTLKDLGFTHCLGLRTDYQTVWDEGSKALPDSPENIRAARDMLNVALESDIGIIASGSPGRWLRTAKVGEPFRRVNRKGDHYGREDISGLFPRVQQFCFDTGSALARAYGDHPAFAATLMHTEVRGESQVSFLPLEREAAKAALGAEIPEVVTIKNGVEYAKLPDFPANRVIADDDPILRSLQWFWTEGDGWNELNTKLNEGLKSGTKREDFWTFYDPAVRVPSIRGSGGTADVLSHWTYSYPDPIRIGLCTDELFEMARVNGHHQDVMKMTQLIWYRSQTAPEKAPEGVETSPWVDQDPDAAYITIAPMHLREAFWWKLSRPITGIMYHGWNSLVQGDSPSAYRFTNGNTAGELRRLTHEVVEPLGPTLLQVPDAPSDVAFLESFTSQMFARRGTYGWNHTWAGDLYHVLMYAQLQPRVMYEESLVAGGLEGVKILVMGDCDVLTESVVKMVTAFQKGGGLVIGDGELCPAITPDILISRYTRTKKAAADKEALQAMAGVLWTSLEGRYQWPLSSDNPDVVTRRRVAGTSDYLFAVNDRREAGTYVGNYGLVMENGLPSEASLKLHRASGHVYDLTAKREINGVKAVDGTMEIPVSLGPCEGRILMVTDQSVEKIAIKAVEKASPGEAVPIRVSVTSVEGGAVDAVVPMELRILDPEGVVAEGSGHYGAAGGVLEMTLDLAPNDRIGLWEIRAVEGATGRESRAYLRVSKSR
ncbi:MAG: LamG domain-containing protein [Verrucomicrobiae bacterium]|nr:LamG domain-containing protein [Verrucomicrobiae bacterium]